MYPLPRRCRTLCARSALALLALASLCGCGGEEQQDHDVTLKGALHKGPFVADSSLTIDRLDDEGVSVGEATSTVTTDDLGSFTASFAHAGLTLLTGEGRYHHEITGETTSTPVTLKALYLVARPGEDEAFVNAFTHLVHRRALGLLSDRDPRTAMAQAEAEAVVALAIGPPGLEPGAPAHRMNLMQSGPLANAYGFAVSAVILEASRLDAPTDSSSEEHLPTLLDALAADLGDGELDDHHVALLEEAERSVITERAEDLLALVADGASPADLDRVIDTDQDDFENIADSCPWIANPDQEPVLDGVCHAVADPVASAPDLVGSASIAFAKLDGDEFFDAVVLDEEGRLSLLAGDGAGALTLVHQEGLSARTVQVADVNDDGVVDLVATDIDEVSVHLRGDEMGALEPPVVSAVYTQGGEGFAIGDMTGDGYPELLAVASFDVAGEFDLPMTLLINDGQGGFTEGPAGAVLPEGMSMSGPVATALEDVDGDGLRDVVIAGISHTGDESVIFTLLGDGEGQVGAPIISRSPLPPGADPEHRGEAAFVDVTGDGLPDVTMMGRGNVAAVVPGRADGSFGEALLSDVGLDLTYGRVVATGDFTGDALIDMAIVVDPDLVEGLHLVVLPSRGSGEFDQAVTRVSRLLGPTSGAISADAADLDGNGADDLLLGLAPNGPAPAAVISFTP